MARLPATLMWSIGIAVGTVTCLAVEIHLPDINSGALDQPELFAILKDGSDILPFGSEEYTYEVFVDTGASGFVVSKIIAEWFYFDASDYIGDFAEVGIAGAEIGDTTRPLTFKMLNGSLDVEDPNQPESAFTDYGEFNLWVRRTADFLEEWDPVSIAGMPVISQAVMVMDPTPMEFWGRLQTFLLPHGDPQIGLEGLDVHVPIELEAFMPDPNYPEPGEAFPSWYKNPVIPGIEIRQGANASTGDWLLDTGAAASFISIEQANAVGLTDKTTLSEIIAEAEFLVPIGGIGGDTTAPGFIIDQVRVPTIEGHVLVFENVEILVIDVAGLDGVFGMNFVVPSIPLSPRQVDGPGYFERIVIDTANQWMGLNVFDEAYVPTHARADLDLDGDVDLDDFTLLVVGLTGAGSLHQPYRVLAGTAVLEAEGADVITPGMSESWTMDNALPASNGRYMVAGVDDGDVIDGLATIQTDAPRLSYPLHFTSTGMYRLWLRGCGDAGSDTVHYGMDGVPQSTDQFTAAQLITGQTFGWTSHGTGIELWLDVDTPGLHTVDLWMRQDGARIDRLIVTTDENFQPSGLGPVGSSRPIGGPLSLTDLDLDGDTDVGDFAIFTAQFTGAQ